MTPITYRLLNEGESTQPGDELFSANGWVKLSSPGWKLCNALYPVRRPLTSIHGIVAALAPFVELADALSENQLIYSDPDRQVWGYNFTSLHVRDFQRAADLFHSLCPQKSTAS